MSTYSKTRILVECAVLVALASVLAVLPAMKLPFGGSVTFASMVPIVLISYRHGAKWGLLSSLVFSVIQMVTGFYPPPVQNFTNYLLLVLLDYVVAFGVLGLARVFAKPFGGRAFAPAAGAFIVTLLRYLCHFLSGMVIWDIYAPQGQPVWLYSISYNGTYMIPEIILTTVVTALLIKFLPKIASTGAYSKLTKHR